ncbi:hypothetical protein GCM10007897_37850 [Sphingobium jiangsuense]|nr:hypothetical protein GCM10007897_37850 [Sphingobium jiangsuense]
MRFRRVMPAGIEARWGKGRSIAAPAFSLLASGDQTVPSSSGSEWNSCHMPFNIPKPTARPSPNIQEKYHIEPSLSGQ